MSLRHPKTEVEAVRRFRYWWPLRHAVTMGHWKRDREQRLTTEDGLRRLIAHIRQFRRQAPNYPEQVKMGRLSQKKGRRAELDDIREWDADGYIVRDKRSQEAAAIKTGVDYVVEGRRAMPPMAGPQFAVQRRKGKKPSLIRAYRDARDGASGAEVPIAHVTFDQDRPGQFGDNVAVIDYRELRVIIKLAYPGVVWDEMP